MVSTAERRIAFTAIVAQLHAARIVAEQHPAAIMPNDAPVSVHADIDHCDCVEEAVRLVNKANGVYSHHFG